VLKWFRSTLDGAGFGRFGLIPTLVAVALGAAMVFALAMQLVPVPAFAASVSIGSLGLTAELLTMRAKARRREIALVWPEVLDSLVSSSSAGISIAESFEDLGKSGPLLLRSQFAELCQDLEFGSTLEGALRKFKNNLGEVHSDRLVEVITLATAAGGGGFYEALRTQATVTRQELALWGEIESKQGWVAGTAKIAVAAPWIIVVLLASRPENLAAYSSETGSMILIIGLVVSVFAYRLIQLLGSVVQPHRVFLT